MYSELRLGLGQPNGGTEDPHLTTHYDDHRAPLDAVNLEASESSVLF
jgi:hypothetical protein